MNYQLTPEVIAYIRELRVSKINFANIHKILREERGIRVCANRMRQNYYRAMEKGFRAWEVE